LIDNCINDIYWHFESGQTPGMLQADSTLISTLIWCF